MGMFNAEPTKVECCVPDPAAESVSKSKEKTQPESTDAAEGPRYFCQLGDEDDPTPSAREDPTCLSQILRVCQKKAARAMND